MAVPAGSLKFPPAMTENAAAEENKEKVEAGPNNPAGSLGFSPVMRGKGAGAKEEKRKDKDDDEEELVVTNPVRASLIYHSFNIAFVLEVIFFIAHIVIYHNASESYTTMLLPSCRLYSYCHFTLCPCPGMFSLRHMPWHLVASIHSVGDELLFAKKV